MWTCLISFGLAREIWTILSAFFSKVIQNKTIQIKNRVLHISLSALQRIVWFGYIWGR